jgi:hypothetical protein
MPAQIAGALLLLAAFLGPPIAFYCAHGDQILYHGDGSALVLYVLVSGSGVGFASGVLASRHSDVHFRAVGALLSILCAIACYLVCWGYLESMLTATASSWVEPLTQCRRM